MARACWFLMQTLLLMLSLACDRATPSDQKTSAGDPAARYLVGAHHYSWFPEAFASGFLRGKLSPPQTPELGLYNGADVKVAERQIDWAAEHGIDFFTLDYWPTKTKLETRHQTFLSASNIGDIQFCIFYETIDLGFDKKADALFFDEKTSRQFVEDLETIADRYFSHPQYLRVQGRPVVLLYITRTFQGAYEQAIAEARRRLKAKGHDLFLIGDEVFWSSQPHRQEPTPGPTATSNQPQVGRIRLFDAITAYNFYHTDQPSHAGYGAASRFLPDVIELSRSYSQITNGEIPVLPSVIPGYNDRGVRPDKDHYVIPRQWAAGESDQSFFEEMLTRYAVPSIAPKVPILFVTSWNEWNEDTAIEPLHSAEGTSKDQSGRQRFTQGYTYSGFGTKALETLRDKTVAVFGTVTAVNGLPLAGQTVFAWKGGDLIATDVSDSKGRFHLSRLNLVPDDYRVGLEGLETVPVTVDPAKAVALLLASDQSAPEPVHSILDADDGMEDKVRRRPQEDSLWLDLGVPKTRHHLLRGFSFDENDGEIRFVWSDRDLSQLSLPLTQVAQRPYVLGLQVRAFASVAPVPVEILVNDVALETIQVGPGWRSHRLAVPTGMLKTGENRLELRYLKTGQPSAMIETSTDHRKLALGIDRVWLAPSKATPEL